MTLYVCICFLLLAPSLGMNSLLHCACCPGTTCLLSVSFLKHFSLAVAGLRARFLKECYINIRNECMYVVWFESPQNGFSLRTLSKSFAHCWSLGQRSSVMWSGIHIYMSVCSELWNFRRKALSSTVVLNCVYVCIYGVYASLCVCIILGHII